MMIPNFASYQYTAIGYVYMVTFTYILLYCDEAPQNFVMIFTYAIHLFIGIGVIYLKPINSGVVLKFLAVICGVSTVGAGMSMTVTHIQNMNRKLHVANEENNKLLNGMHEGVLIQSDSSSVMFCN